MILNHLWGLLTHPDDEWESIRREPNTLTRHYLAHAVVLAAIPSISLFIGSSQIGWTVGSNGLLYKLTSASAMQISIMMYFAILAGIFVLGKFIDFFSKTYQADDHTPRGLALASYTSTPMLVAGIIAVFPIVWLNMLLVIVGVAYAVYLLYEGMPILMQIPKERGFMFATSVATVGLVMLVGLITITVIAWTIGFGPEFISQIK